MDGNFFALIAAIVHVLIEENLTLKQRILEKAEYYRRYIFYDGADSLSAMERALELIQTDDGSRRFKSEDNDGSSL